MRFPLVSSFIIHSQSAHYVTITKQGGGKKHEEEEPCDMVIMPKTFTEEIPA